jgi:hypothetical protein
MEKSRTIREIIKDAGGASAIAGAVGGKITPDAVYQWPHNGIPDRYWSAIMPLANASADELFLANEMVRAEKVA